MLFSLCADSRPSRRHVCAAAHQTASVRTARRSRHGFTLVELLVVMTIIGLLMSLLIPAVNSARESARRGVCLNNLKQLSTAAMKYNDRRRELPGYVNVIGKSSTAIASATPPVGATANVPNRLGTWAMMLFPEIERSDIYQTWNSDPAIVTTPAQPVPATPYIALFVCPSDPPDDATTNPTPLSYVANCGIPDNTATLTATNGNNGSNGVALIVDNTLPAVTSTARPTNGMFYDRYSYKYSTTAAPIPDLSSSLDRIPDGASSTLMFSENFMPTSKDINNGFLYRVYYPPVNSTFYTTATSTEYPHLPLSNTATEAQFAAGSFEADIGFIWDPRVPNQTTPNDPRRINGDNGRKNVANYPQNNASFAYYYSRPSSSHPGGVNVATCGGECFFLRDDIDYWVYEQLMTPDGKHSQMAAVSSTGIPPTNYVTPFNAQYILSDTDYK